MTKNYFELTGKIALVVGGRGYLGDRFCTALSASGAIVYAADLPKVSAAKRKSDANDNEDKAVRQRQVDVTDARSVQTLVDGIVREEQRIDILVYSVTAKPKDFYAPFTACSLDGWRKVLQVELNGLFLTAQAVGRVMESQKQGNMIFLSSIYGVVGNDQRIYEGANLAALYGDVTEPLPKQIYSHAAYNVAKGGAIALMRYLAAYWGSQGIRVNSISPGGVAHPGENEAFVSKYTARVPMGRKANPDEVVGAMLFLASEAASYITGHNLMVDGGWTAW